MKIGREHSTSIPALTEAEQGGLLGRLKGALGGLANRIGGGIQTAKNMASNPAYAQQQLAASGAAATNERAAKLAVQILSDNIRQKFQAALSANGLTPDQIIQTYDQWKKLKPKAEAGDQQALATYNQAADTLKKAFKLFNHGNKKHQFNQIEVV